MEKFTQHKGLVVPLDRDNVDTDAIIPKQFLKSIKRTGFGPNLFDAWRYLDEGEPGMDNSKRRINPDFVLNQPRYAGASILVAGENFGCGSSREHAPWALQQYGFKVIIAPSYADIFINNCFKNGLLAIELETDTVRRLMVAAKENSAYELDIQLQEQKITEPNGNTLDFEVDAFRKHCLLNGLDEIGLTLDQSSAIESFESRRLSRKPWLAHTLTQ